MILTRLVLKLNIQTPKNHVFGDMSLSLDKTGCGFVVVLNANSTLFYVSYFVILSTVRNVKMRQNLLKTS